MVTVSGMLLVTCSSVPNHVEMRIFLILTSSQHCCHEHWEAWSGWLTLPRYCWSGHLYSRVQLYMSPLNLTYVVPTRWPRSPSLCGLQGPTHPLTHSVAEYHDINDIYIKYVQVPLVSKNLQYYLLLQTAGWSKTRKISNCFIGAKLWSWKRKRWCDHPYFGSSAREDDVARLWCWISAIALLFIGEA